MSEWVSAYDLVQVLSHFYFDISRQVRTLKKTTKRFSLWDMIQRKLLSSSILINVQSVRSFIRK